MRGANKKTITGGKPEGEINNARPFLKWAGGKGQLLETFFRFYPDELKSGRIKHYFEPFIGGGAVFFDIASRFEIQSAVLYDINEELILSYRIIQKDVHKLIEKLDRFEKKYHGLNDDGQIRYFYEIRSSFNAQRKKTNFGRYSESWINRAAQIIFLNKTCYNGLFRFNSSGEFNTPKGRYKNPKILDEQNLLNVSDLLQIAELRNAHFLDVEKDVKDRSFVYFDPPYRPISKTASFTSYSKHAFTDEEQNRLAELYQRLDERDVRLMLSNSDPRNTNPDDHFFDELYKPFYIFRVPARRMINSVASKREAVKEIIVTNYKI